MSTWIYPARRAVERAVTTAGARPIRFFAVMLPAWQVEITTTTYASEPYEVFDRFLSRGIDEAGLATVDELADFFGVQRSLVVRAIGFLDQLGHVQRAGDRVQLTELGRDSVRLGKRLRPQEDRRHLYFDGFTSSPFPRSHYAANLFSDESDFRGSDNGQFTVLGSSAGFDNTQIDAVLSRPDRRNFNVPDGLTAPRPLLTGQAWLPAYLVLDAGPIRVQAFTSAVEGRDTHVEAICAELTEDLRAEDERDDPLVVWQRWLAERGYRDVRPQRLANGALRAVLPASAFGASKTFKLYRLGSFEVRRSSFMQLWCEDGRLRRQAVVDGAASIARAKRAIADDELAIEIERLAALLEVDDLPTTDEVRRLK